MTIENPAFAKRQSLTVMENAKRAGAEMIVTACPLCYYNLKKSGCELPVVYLTELLAEALGVKEDAHA
jgi:heterodisulfide reductase subunit B